MTEENEQMSLLELLTRTRLQIFTYKQGKMMQNAYPNGAGSGFFIRHKGRIILVTADHCVILLTTYQAEHSVCSRIKMWHW